MPAGRLTAALPFWLSLGFVPIFVLGAAWGGGWLALSWVYAFGVITLLDRLLGLNTENPATDVPLADLFWYRAVTLIWFPI